MTPTLPPVLSPCTGVCTIDEAGLCHGCRRTSDEIAGWMEMGDAERIWVMDVVLPQRETGRSR